MKRYFQQRENTSSGYALILSIILLTVLAAVVALMSVSALSSLQSVTTARDATYFDMATETAVADAVRVANNPGTGESFASHVGKTNAVFGDVDDEGQYKYRWYLLPVAGAYSGLSYDLHITGYRGDNPDDANTSRHVTVRMVSFPTTGARWIGETVFYRPTPVSVYSWGVFGSGSVTLSGNTQVSSFDSASGVTGKSGDVVGTNGVLTTSTGTTLSRILMMNSYPGNSAIERCVGGSCDPTIINDARYGMDLSVVDEWIESACPIGSGPYPSVNGSTITIDAKNPNCFDDVSLRGNVNINYVNGQPSTGRPAQIFIRGNLQMDTKTTFNNGGNTSISGAMILHTYVSGDQVSIGASGAGGAGSTTDVRLLLATSNTTHCAIGSPSNSTQFWGAAVCGTLDTNGNVHVQWDEQTNAIAGDEDMLSQRIWSVDGYMNPY